MKYHLPKEILVLFLGTTCFFLVWIAVSPRSAALFLWNGMGVEFAGKIDPQNPGLQFAIGEHYFNGGTNGRQTGVYDLKRAKYWYLRADALDPHHPLLNWQLARIYFLENNLIAAEHRASLAIADAPNDPRAYYVRGLIRGFAGDIDGAIEDYKRDLALRPNSWATWNDLAWLYFTKGDYAETARVARDGLKHTPPENPWLNNALGVALYNLGDIDGARAALLVAKKSAWEMLPESWGRAYPGNDPREYARGLASFRAAIDKNIALLDGDNSPVQKDTADIE